MSHQQKPNGDGRLFAVLAYILPVIGGIIGLIFNRSNELTRIHAVQSIGAVLTLILTFVTWAVVGLIISMIPLAGPVVASALFALVIAMGIFLIVNWIISLIHAAQGKGRIIPIANRLTIRLFGEARKAKPTEAVTAT